MRIEKMMKKNYILFAALGLLANTLVESSIAAPDNLEAQRQATIVRYVHDLGTADVNDILQLFDGNAVLFTDSKGRVSAREFFAGFLPSIAKASTNVGSIYKNPGLKNQYLGSFQFVYVKNDGQSGGGNFSDRFVFQNNSSLLHRVDMYEKFN